MWQQSSSLHFWIAHFLENGQPRAIQPALIVHGGAGDITDDRIAAKFDGMKAAIRVGYQILEDTDNPMDAVERAVNVLENLYAFNAGQAVEL